ncbi:MAG: CopD family protein [Burkholderiales bacterium]
MQELSMFLHLAGAVVWVGGMAFVLLALRPVAIAQMPPPARIPLLTAVLRRFFVLVWISIALLAATGAYMIATVGMKNAPVGVHAMLAIGLLMIAIFGYIWLTSFRRLQTAAAAKDWPEAGRQLARIHPLVVTNFLLGWLAIAAVVLMH